MLTCYQIARQYGDADGRISRESFARLRSTFPMIGEFEDLIDKPENTFVSRENINAYIKLVSLNSMVSIVYSLSHDYSNKYRC